MVRSPPFALHRIAQEVGNGFDWDMLMPFSARHLHRHCLVSAQRLPQGILHRHRLNYCRNQCKPPPRASAWLRAVGQDRREIPRPANSVIRATGKRRGRQHLHLEEL